MQRGRFGRCGQASVSIAAAAPRGLSLQQTRRRAQWARTSPATDVCDSVPDKWMERKCSPARMATRGDGSIGCTPQARWEAPVADGQVERRHRGV
eukprot:100438-Prymnesium_polylepis.1